MYGMHSSRELTSRAVGFWEKMGQGTGGGGGGGGGGNVAGTR